MAKKQKKNRSTKKKKQKSPKSNSAEKHTACNNNVPTAYVQDLVHNTTAGYKLKAISERDYDNTAVFQIKNTNAEKKRRLERMMRFEVHNEAASAGTSSNISNGAAEEAVMMELSAPRSSDCSGKKQNNSRKQQQQSKQKILNNKNINAGGEGFGTSTKLEKPYLRLTSQSKPEDVRPLRILKLAFARLQEQYLADDVHSYPYVNEQLKSIRQDLTVQEVRRNSFGLEVYETHARIALEHGDLNEFNQCQTVIKSLVQDDGGEISSSLLRQSVVSEDEFAAYRLLYALVQNERYDINNEMASIMTRLKNNERRHRSSSKAEESSTKASTHAVQVAQAIATTNHCNYSAFFRLYVDSPYHSCYLMDYLVQRVRLASFPILVSSYRPTIALDHFVEVFGFVDYNEAMSFLKQEDMQAELVHDEKQGGVCHLDCKATYFNLNPR